MSSSNTFADINMNGSVDYSKKYKKIKKEYNELENYLKSVMLNHNNEINEAKKEYKELTDEYSKLYKTFEYNEKIAQKYVDKYEDKIEDLSKENNKLSKQNKILSNKLESCLKKTNKDSQSELARETLLKNIITKHLIKPKRRSSTK